MLNFLENHSLTNVKPPSHIQKNETAFTTDGSVKPGDKEGGGGGSTSNNHQKSKLCSYWQAGECELKEEHTWSQCPRNPYSKNYNKKCNDKG